MENMTTREQRALNLMNKDNFRGISKDNVMHLVSILDKVNPEVAKDLIHQLPGMIQGITEDEKVFSNLLTKGIDSSDCCMDSCYNAEDEIIKTLQAEVDKEGTSFEQKQYYIDKMVEAAERKEIKDTEHKDFVMNIVKHGKEVVIIGLLLTAGIFIGRANIHLPRVKTV